LRVELARALDSIVGGTIHSDSAADGSISD
jgi:hypothetical protein